MVGFTANERTRFAGIDSSPFSSQKPKGPWSSPGPGELQVTASSNKTCVTVCEWGLEKMDKYSPFDAGLMMCCSPKLSLFSKQKVLLKK